MNILVAGDFCQKYRVDEAVRSKRFGEIFDKVKPIIESVDYSIVNFEFPIVLDSKIARPIKKCGPNLKGTIEAVDAIKYTGFKCCTLANNHILDQGNQCCLDTKIELEKALIDTVGAGKNIEEAGKILYKEIKGEILAVINCCEHEFSIATETSAGANPLNPIAQYYKIQEARKNADYVLVIVHGGHEHFQLPSVRMQETYRFFIDAGADAVVNHHQHCYSGYEVYNSKPIFYGIGNFCFDIEPIRDNTIWNYGYVVKIEFGKEIRFNTIPYNQYGKNPSIELLEERKEFDSIIEGLNCTIKDLSKLSSSIDTYYTSSDVQTALAYEPIENRVLKKLYKMGLFPSLVSKEKKTLLYNFINCEAHRDKLIHSLNKSLE